MKRKKLIDDVDVLIPNEKGEKGMPFIVDARDKDDQKTPPKIGVEAQVINGKYVTRYVCIPCGFKTPEMEEFKKHENECEKLK